jgi:murein DD-endopeptidase MepM/ murein hydrolase activator NlpD
MDRRMTRQLVCLIGFLVLAGCNESGRPLSDGTAGPAFNGQAPIMGVEQGGTYVVAAGDTVGTIADRTNTPVRSLIDLNHLQPPYVLKSGQRLILQPGATYGSNTGGVGQTMTVPMASADGSSAPVTAPSGGVSKAALPPLTPAKGSAQPAAQSATATQAPQVLQTKSIPTQPMTAATSTANATTTAATTVANTAAKSGANQINNATTAAATATTNAANAASKTTGTVVNGEPAVAIPDFPDAPANAAPATQTASAAPMTAPGTTGNGQFGWPVQGKIISKYGATADGLRNDGVNIAAPVGAPVVAAADGVVAYAGNELRGFGNMILIRHADGWVTAYAHNQSLTVKKGDAVKRGQTIARVGQTGNVTSPQLHFEIRKGTSAQDPMKYLGS